MTDRIPPGLEARKRGETISLQLRDRHRQDLAWLESLRLEALRRCALGEVNPMHTIIRDTLVIVFGIAAAAMITALGFNWRDWLMGLMGVAAIGAAQMTFRYLFGGRHSE